MALEGSFHELSLQLHNLQESLLALRTTTLEDKPANDDVVLVELFGDATDDLLGWMEGALLASDEAQQAVRYPTDFNRLWRSLSLCHQRVNHLQQRYTFELIAYDRLAELNDLAERRGGEWQAWATSVKAALEDCRHPLCAIGDSIFLCWQEMGERIGLNTVHLKFDMRTCWTKASAEKL